MWRVMNSSFICVVSNKLGDQEMSWLGELLAQNSSDPRERLELGQQLLSQLQISRLSSDSALLNDFCDLVVQWLSGSNYKVMETTN